MTEAEVNDLFDSKVRRGMFAPLARHLTNPLTAEERLQDAVAQTWLMFKRYALDRGHLLDDAILVHSCRQRAVDLARRFVGSNGASWRNQDVLDPRAYTDGKIEVLRLDGVNDDQRGEGDRGLQVGYAESLAANPGRKIRSAIDLQRWLGDLSHRDRAVLEMRMAGHTFGQIAAELGASSSAIFARTRSLGLALASRAGVRIEQANRAEPSTTTDRSDRTHWRIAEKNGE